MSRSFSILFCVTVCGLVVVATFEGFCGNLGTACILGVLTLLSITYIGAEEADIRQSRALLVSFIAGLSVMVCLSGLSPRNAAKTGNPADSKVLKLCEGMILGYMAVHSLTEYAFLQAQADDQDRRELFTRLTGFFSRYDSVRAASPPPASFRAFSGHGFKVANN
jgi:hypothetical protein